MIDEKKKIIFIHYAKCGGESIEQSIFGRSDTGYNGDPYEGSPQKHWGCKEYINHYGQEMFDQYFVFTFVRNPWARAVSRIMYINKRRGREMDITPELLRTECCLNEVIYDDLIDNKKRCRVDFVGKVENFQSDFNSLCDKIERPHHTLPHNNKTTHKHYTEYYDDETKQIVAEKYARDIEYFGYKFGE